ncbi:T9SS type B sorting domain-containing protein [Parapedobacter soli]|uniref:T9SS type B sorting domain-containing protein n=1 Tax=Parapedobacter soli TaxID=416955 RepID=UPI0021CA7382|nr:gliding motility-associated C-terminal domain-containing protein [Parapedobacter soli]
MKCYLFLLALITTLFPAYVWSSGTASLPHVTSPWDGEGLVPDDTAGVIFYDDFGDGSLTRWQGGTVSFKVADGLVGLAEGAQSPASIAVPSAHVRNTLWEIAVMAPGSFSASNYIRLYLAATTASLHEQQWGYHLQIDGDETNHVYRLWRQNGLTRVVIFESNQIPNPDGLFRVRIRVTCNHRGEWQVYVDDVGDGEFGLLAGQSNKTMIKDDTYGTSRYSGYLVSFSQQRRSDFKIDYFLIKQLDRSVPPDTLGMPRAGDILINELLSNPKPDGVDFLEIFNYSSKTIDLSEVSVARVNTNGTVGSPQPIAHAPTFIYPNEYKVLTRQPAVIKQHYPNAISAAFIEMVALPDFNNETGGVVIHGPQGAIDSLFYTPAMQSPFLISNRGVSLERQHVSLPTNEPGNFRSAAVAAGGATPGYRNSQSVDGPAEEQIFLTSKTFSPDGDGFEDRLEINYRLPESGFMANIDIYNDQGVLVKRLVRNESVATQGTIYWDGVSDANIRLPVGVYIAVIEVYSAQGVRKIYRRSVVLAARL